MLDPYGWPRSDKGLVCDRHLKKVEISLDAGFHAAVYVLPVRHNSEELVRLHW